MTVKILFTFNLLLITLFYTSPAWSGDIANLWDSFEKDVRYGKLEKKKARQTFIKLHGQLIDIYFGKIDTGVPHFPIKGYGPSSIGGEHGSGFKPSGYNFFDGNRHKGHPAHDIFVHDKDQDSLDDRTGKPVDILAFLEGVTVSTNNTWTYPDDNRSGKYVWIFTPHLELYCQYVHMGNVIVNPGDVVKSGTLLGTMGRTGKNAYPGRSPTHLHFMCFKYGKGNMIPYDTYKTLLKALTE